MVMCTTGKHLWGVVYCLENSETVYLTLEQVLETTVHVQINSTVTYIVL